MKSFSMKYFVIFISTLTMLLKGANFKLAPRKKSFQFLARKLATNTAGIGLHWPVVFYNEYPISTIRDNSSS